MNAPLQRVNSIDARSTPVLLHELAAALDGLADDLEAIMLAAERVTARVDPTDYVTTTNHARLRAAQERIARLASGEALVPGPEA